MGSSQIDSEMLSSDLAELKKRKPDTKYQLVQVLVELGDSWHLLSEIKELADKKKVSTSHLFENLLELSRLSFIETDFKIKRVPKLSSFKVSSKSFPELKRRLSS